MMCVCVGKRERERERAIKMKREKKEIKKKYSSIYTLKKNMIAIIFTAFESEHHWICEIYYVLRNQQSCDNAHTHMHVSKQMQA